MTSLEDFQRAIERLPILTQQAIVDWLQESLDTRYRCHRIAEPRSIYQVAQPPFMTVEEYLDFEERSPVRHEYINGAVHAMSGASRAHNEIIVSLAAAFHTHLQGGPCKVFSSDLKLYLRSDSDDIFYYPDVMVACRREDWGTHFVRNPRLVVEVLSSSTHVIDRREKSLAYHSVASVEEYVLAAQDEPRLIIHNRSDRWAARVVAGLEAVAELKSIGLALPMRQVYGDVLA